MLRRKRADRDPLIEPSIFTHRGYSAGALVLMLYFGGLLGSMLAGHALPADRRGLHAIHAGLTIAPFALGTALAAPAASIAMARVGGRVIIQAGTLISIAGYAVLAIILGSTSHVSTWGLFGPLLVDGIGMGLFVDALIRHDHRGGE